MPYGDILEPPIKIASIGDPEAYYRALPGSALIVKIFDNELNLIARGLGFSFAENYQNFPVMELGQRHCIEIVAGAMPPGQINYQGMYFMNLNDTLPTYKNLVSTKTLSALVQVAEHEDPSISGIVLDVFKGIVIQGQQGNFNASTLYLRNANMIYTERLTGIEYKKQNADSKYPATAGGIQVPVQIGTPIEG